MCRAPPNWTSDGFGSIISVVDRVQRVCMENSSQAADGDSGMMRATAREVRSSMNGLYINVIASALAVFVSMVSLLLAYSSNRTQERMLAAASWPYLSYSQGNSDGAGNDIVSLEVRNGGSGPAVLHWLIVRGEGRDLTDGPEVLAWAVPGESGLSNWSSSTTGLPLPPGEGVRFFRYAKDSSSLQAWSDVDRARWKIVVEGCYCSIIDECWRFGESTQPVSVDRCGPAPRGAWTPK